jgi:RimJ/RimL family protein N-acetyltransferase
MRTWPLYDLRIQTPRLELRLPDLEMLDELSELAARGVHDRERMPFKNAWTDKPSPELERSVVQYSLLQVASWSPERWTYNPVVCHQGRVIGTQDMRGQSFAVSRSFSTGSWLGREYQGRGFGREMRAAILHLGFAGLGAEEALTSAFSDNPASLGVSRSLGYEPNGSCLVERRRRPAEHLSYRLSRERWLTTHDLEVRLEGLEPCLELFGLAEQVA